MNAGGKTHIYQANKRTKFRSNYNKNALKKDK